MRSAPHLFSAAVSSLILANPHTAALAQSTSPGWAYTINMTTDSGGPGRVLSMAMRYQVTARNLRMDFVQVSGMPGGAEAEGMYQVLDDRDSSMMMVMPQAHMATKMNMNGVLAAIPSAVPTVDVQATTSAFQDLGQGESILGHATHHYRTTSSGTRTVTISGETCSATFDIVSEMWFASDVDLLPAMRSVAGHYGVAMGMSIPQASQTETNQATPKGTALRTIVTRTGPGASGQSVSVKTIVEYVEMSARPIDVSVFAVPADYHVMDMRTMMADMPAGMLDSAMKAGAAQQAEKSKKILCGT